MVGLTVGVVVSFVLNVDGVNSETRQDPWSAMATVLREIPEPGLDHPGNVFVLGETMSVPLDGEGPAPAGPRASAVSWRVLDDQLAVISQGKLSDKDQNVGRCALGQLGIGWYKVAFLDGKEEVLDWTTAAVLAKLKAPVPQDSPIGLDTALSWYPVDGPADREKLTQLAALAGVNWMRDRLDWRHVQPGMDTLEPHTKYDEAAELQTRYGLKVLQVYHRTPDWAVAEGGKGGHAPEDLRHTYRFCKTMAERFKGNVAAWEPWNEGNASNFGAHTIDELCAHQKAAYLGFKAGGPDIVVGWNPLGGSNIKPLADGVLANETWPYFDTYNIHSYDWPHAYEELWVHARAAACGRPIWVTECDRGLHASPESPWGDFTHDDTLRKAQVMAQSYVSSLAAGAHRHFHFILGHYTEGDGAVQFGLLRKDMTPRPSYVALAALGRLLAGGRYLGRWSQEGQPNTYVHAFRAQPDGKQQDVFVAWTEEQVDWPRRGKAHVDWTLPEDVRVERAFDYLGRPIGESCPGHLASAPVFIVMPPGEVAKLTLAPPYLGEYREGAPSPAVMQILMPESTRTPRKKAWTPEHLHAVAPGNEVKCTLDVYNFGDSPVSGRITLEDLPEGWKLEPQDWEVALDPMQRRQLKMRLTTSSAQPMPDSENGESDDPCIRLRGDFDGAGRPALAFCVLPHSDKAE